MASSRLVVLLLLQWSVCGRSYELSINQGSDNSSIKAHNVTHSISIRQGSVIGQVFSVSSHQKVPSHLPIASPQANTGNTINILTQPLRLLVLRSFEGYRRLMKDAYRIEDVVRGQLGLPKRTRLPSLDPLSLPEPVTIEHRDKSVPVLGKVVFTMTDISISGLSDFYVEELNGLGRSLSFQHVMPNLDSVANYSIDYHLFDAIPLRVSSGKLTARIPNARVRGTFQIFPDIMKAWFRVAHMNLTTWAEDMDLKFYPNYLISPQFTIDNPTADKIHSAFNHFLPNVTDLLKVTYTKAIEMKLV